MCNGPRSLFRRGLIVTAILALAGWRGASAGLYTMEETLADFAFDDASIVYGKDSHAPSDKQKDAENGRPDAPSSMSRTAQSYGTGDGLRGVMTLRSGQDIAEDLVRGRFNVFGSLTTAASHPTGKLLTDTLDKMGGAKKPTAGPGVFNQKDRMIGSLATKYRGYGIYFSVGGLDELTWINEMSKAIAKGGDVIELSSEADSATAESALAIPAPGTFALLLVGGFTVAASSRRRRDRRCAVVGAR